MRLIIAKHRKRKGLTQAELAALVGMKRSALAQYETGTSGVPITALLSKLAQALEVNVGELFEQEDREETLSEESVTHA